MICNFLLMAKLVHLINYFLVNYIFTVMKIYAGVLSNSWENSNWINSRTVTPDMSCPRIVTLFVLCTIKTYRWRE